MKWESMSDCTAKVEPCFEDLPKEIQLIIFSYFTPQELSKTVGPVCKDWLRISRDPALWKTLNITSRGPPRTSQLAERLRKVLRRCSMLRTLTLVGLPPLEVEQFYSCSLRDYHISHVQINEDFFRSLGSSFPFLESLLLNNCTIKGDTQEIAEEISNLRRLKCLDFDRSRCVDRDFDDVCLSTIANKCPYLESMGVSHTVSLTDASLSQISRCLLTRLKKMTVDIRNFTNEGLSSFLSCSNLVDLRLKTACEITDQTMEALVDLSLKTLELSQGLSLPVQENKRVTSNALMKFFSGPRRPSLRSLFLQGFIGLDDEVLVQVAKACPELEILDIPNSQWVTESGLMPFFSKPPKLRQLNLTCCSNISRLGVLKILKICKLYDKDVNIIINFLHVF